MFETESTVIADNLITINVGGQRSMISAQKLRLFPETVLGRLVSKLDNGENIDTLHGKITFLQQTNECFVDRSPALFDCILNLYRTGCIHFPETICPEAFWSELKFWEIPREVISPCCESLISESLQAEKKISQKFWENRTILRQITNFNEGVFTHFLTGGHRTSAEPCDPFQFSSTTEVTHKSLKPKVWEFLETPNSSKFAVIYMSFSCMMVLITMAVLIMSSMSSYQFTNPDTNETIILKDLEIVDGVCVGFFSIEYLARLWSAPNKCHYVKSPLSIIDMIAIFPFFLEAALNSFGFSNSQFQEIRRSLVLIRILRVLRVLRALRILKVARYSKGFQSMGLTLRRSWKELTLLVMFILTATFMFSTAMYFIEAENPQSHFGSIPAACWWAIITMTTVGYGDVYPVSVGGKILAGMVSITGIILLAFPISVIVETFNQEYRESHTEAPDESQEAADELGANEVEKIQHLLKHMNGKLYLQIPTRNRRQMNFF